MRKPNYKKRKLPSLELIVEGEIEEKYFKDFIKAGRKRNIKIEKITVSNSKKEIIKKAKNSQSDYCFIIIDRDGKQFKKVDIEEIEEKIKTRKSIKKVLYSKPCFELWILSHFYSKEDGIAQFKEGTFQNKLKEKIRNYKKNTNCPIFEKTKNLLKKARETNKELCKSKRGNYSLLFEFFDCIDKYASS